MDYYNLKNSTIIIPTYKRYPYLVRLLKFYESYKLNIKILVLDSTPNDLLNEELTRLLSNKNIVWKKFDAAITFWEKISKGIEFIETEYVTLCADDDFIIPGAIVECIKFLEINSDYASAHGLYFNHLNDKNFRRSKFRMNPLYNHGRLSDEKTGVERVQAYFNGKTNYYPFYAVHRTSTFKLIWTETKQYVSAWGLGEVFPCSLSFAYGKMMILQVFYASREPNNYNWIDEKIHTEIYSEERIERAVIGLGKHLSIVDNLLLEEAELVARKAFEVHLDKANNKQFKKKANHNIFLLWMRIKHKLRIRTRMISLIRYLRYQGCHPDIYPEYFKDFMKVKKAVLTARLSFDELNIARRDQKN